MKALLVERGNNPRGAPVEMRPFLMRLRSENDSLAEICHVLTPVSNTSAR